MRPIMKRLALVLICALAASAALGQGKKQESSQRMSREERQRMRDDVRDAYRQRSERPQKARQQMSPEERRAFAGELAAFFKHRLRVAMDAADAGGVRVVRIPV